MLMASLDTSIANAGLPTLAQAFGATFPQVQWIVLAYLLAVTTLIVSVGRLGDLLGRRRLLIFGVALFTGASVACGSAPSLGTLVAARVFQGVGAAVMMSLTIAFVSELAPKTQAGSAMGLIGTMSAVGTALGPTLGGVLMSTIGWNAIFLINVPVGLLSLYLAHRFLPLDATTKDVTRPAFDYLGTLLLASSLGAYALAMTTGQSQPGWVSVALILIAALGAGFFVRVERKVGAPLIRLELLGDRKLKLGLVASVVVSTVIMSTLVVGPFYLSRGLGLSPMHVGLTLSVGPVVVALLGIPAGRLADRKGTTLVTLIGLGAIMAGSMLLVGTSIAHGVLGYLLPIVAITSGYALFQTANNTAIMTGVSADQTGVMSGMLSLSRNLGLITGASAMGSLFSFFAGVSHDTPTAVASGMRFTFLVAAGLVAVTFSLILSANRAHARSAAATPVRC